MARGAWAKARLFLPLNSAERFHVRTRFVSPDVATDKCDVLVSRLDQMIRPFHTSRADSIDKGTPSPVSRAIHGSDAASFVRSQAPLISAQASSANILA
jgi:hypothetical protein